MSMVLEGIAALLGTVGVLIAYFIYLPRIRHWTFPGPKPWLLEGSLSGRKIKPGTAHQALYDLRNKYGNVFQVWLGIRRLVVLSDEEDIKYITLTNPMPKCKSFNESLAPMTGEGLISVREELHKSHRRFLSAGFNDEFVRGIGQYISLELTTLFDKLDQACPGAYSVDMDKEITKFAMDIVFRAAFSETIGVQTQVDLPLLKAFNDALKEIFRCTAQNARKSQPFWENTDSVHSSRYHRNTGTYPFWKYMPAKKRFTKAKAVLDIFLSELVDRRRNESSAEKANRQVDILDLILQMNLSEEDIRGEALTFLVAGHDTTSHSLAFCLYNLACNPNVEAIMAEEVESVLGDRTVPSYEDCQNLPYTTAVWKETLRLNPVAATGTMRDAVEDLTLPSGHFIARGAELLVPLYVMHRNPDYWEDPLVFKPERFLTKKRPSPFIYMPFSVGPRNCIGQGFAGFEGVATLAALVKRYKTKLAVEPNEVREFHAMVMRPRCVYNGKSAGLPMYLARR
ncbi:hypothetical protein NDN08_001596 [Rhodosorus marinus]|uniref:Cytochrome P450 n=1 Tax=Rhodosorus marinus TaxID=101924 RepID=A0AAV8URB2_9RHOD|nr:hypothetical protein NDN08_001596 [Rhodosorus marinus]